MTLVIIDKKNREMPDQLESHHFQASTRSAKQSSITKAVVSLHTKLSALWPTFAKGPLDGRSLDIESNLYRESAGEERQGPWSEAR